MKRRLLAPVGIAVIALAACHVDVTVLGDMRVNWTIDGSNSSTQCGTYGIESWTVEITGPEQSYREFSCAGSWNSGTVFYGVEEGFYDVTVSALDATGAVLATQTVTNVDVLSDLAPATAVAEFIDSDFGVTAQGVLNAYWNINGTVDGTAKGVSWDTCDEVGAQSAEVEVDGQAASYDCHASGNMSAAVNGLAAQPQVRIRLLDSSNQPLTTWTNAAAADPVSGKTDTWEYVAEFYFDSFSTLKDTMTGDYLFQTSFEGQSCTQTSPNVAHQVSLLKLGGAAVNPAPDVCGPDSQCSKADGADFASCYGPNQTQSIAGQLWGEYKLKLSGALPASESYEICWEKEFDILIGAGTDNPVVPLDVDRYSSTGACTP